MGGEMGGRKEGEVYYLRVFVVPPCSAYLLIYYRARRAESGRPQMVCGQRVRRE
jgi:hypothetical protein